MIVAARPTWAGYKSALPWYRRAAEAGLADAQYAMANVHSHARGVVHNDDVEARKWLERAALNGLDTAQLELGIWLANGRGGAKDPVKALQWLRRAAGQRNVLAQNRLARMYAFGVGTQKDTVRAGAWYVIATRGGYSDPQMNVRFNAMSQIDKKRSIDLANRLQPR